MPTDGRPRVGGLTQAEGVPKDNSGTEPAPQAQEDG